MPLQKQLVPVQFTQGIETKADPKTVVSGKLLELENGIFSSPGKIKKRNGYTALSSALTTPTALATYNDELLQFANGNLVYSYSSAGTNWNSKGTAVSIAVGNDHILNDRSNQQLNTDAAYTSNLCLVAWEDSRHGVRYSLLDTVTNQLILSDQLASVDGYEPKCIAFNSQLILLYINGLSGRLVYRALSTTSPYSMGTQTDLITDLRGTTPIYDVCVTSSKLIVGYYNTTSYKSAWFSTIGGSPTSYTHGSATGGKSLATFVDSSNNYTVVSSATARLAINVQNSSGANIISDATVGGVNPPRIVIYAISSTVLGILYEVAASPAYNTTIRQFTYNTQTFLVTGPTDYLRSVSLYSKSFTYGTQTYLTVAYESTLQNTYFITDSSGNIIARLKPGLGGGLRTNHTIAQVPQQSSSVFLLPLLNKSRIISEGQTIFSLLGVSLSTLDFNSSATLLNETLGNTLHLTGGISQIYDGISFIEDNFLLYPENITVDTSTFTVTTTQQGTASLPEKFTIACVPFNRMQDGEYITFTGKNTGTNYYLWFENPTGVDPAPPGKTAIKVQMFAFDTPSTLATKVSSAILAAASSDFATAISTNVVTVTNTGNGNTTDAANVNVSLGNMAAGDYLYKVTYEFDDNWGQTYRSITSNPLTATVATANSSATLVIPTLRLTNKANQRAATTRIVIYRTEVGQAELYYRVTSVLVPLLNSTTADTVYFIDGASDATILSNELLYTTGGTLDNAAPPPCTLIASYKTRLFLAGFDDPNLIWFSKTTIAGAPVEFSQELTMQCDARGGSITALGNLDDRLVVFKHSAIFEMAGEGPNNDGSQNDYGAGPQLITTDVGCTNANSLCVSPVGLFFKSAKGLYLLGRSGQAEYIGAPVEAYNDRTITSAKLVANTNHVRFTTSDDVMLVYDYYMQQWSVFTGLAAKDSEVWRDTYVVLKVSDGYALQETAGTFTDNSASIQLNLTTSWLAFAGLQGFERIWRLLLLGTYKGSHTLRVSVAFDYQDTYVQTTNITPSLTIGDPYQYRIHLAQQKCEAMKVNIKDIGSTNEAFDISALTLEVGTKIGAKKLSTTKSVGNS